MTSGAYVIVAFAHGYSQFDERIYFGVQFENGSDSLFLSQFSKNEITHQ